MPLPVIQRIYEGHCSTQQPELACAAAEAELTEKMRNPPPGFRIKKKERELRAPPATTHGATQGEGASAQGDAHGESSAQVEEEGNEECLECETSVCLHIARVTSWLPVGECCYEDVPFLKMVACYEVGLLCVC